MSKLTLFRDAAPPDTEHVPARITAGAPVTRYRVVAGGEDGRLSAGIWQATPGAWRVSYTEWEYCYIVAGRAVLTEDGEAPIAIGPGDGLTLAPGFTGIWQVSETMTKHFVILDPPA